MTLKILLVNPAIYDFTAYDFWLKPYGLLSVAGYLRGKADFKLFDHLDRAYPLGSNQKSQQSDDWGRGRFQDEIIQPPDILLDIPRHFRRFGRPRLCFEEFLKENEPSDYVFIQTMMTYWYPAVAEVIEDVRKYWPKSKIVLGGNYVTLCPEHAEKLCADFVLKGTNLNPLWDYLKVEVGGQKAALWELYDKLDVGVLKLSQGCPFNCTYCSVPQVYKEFKVRSIECCLEEVELLYSKGVSNIAFYDDALLFRSDEVLVPFLNEVLKKNIKVNFHCPNALNARFITKALAALMVRSGFKTFYLGFECISRDFQKQTGSKVYSEELVEAVKHLTAAGAKHSNITAYHLLGHPDCDVQQIEDSMNFSSSLGIRGMLADFSPIPGTIDGQKGSKWVDMDEPLFHNKTAFTIIRLGNDESNRLKDLQRYLNHQIPKD